MMYIPKPDLRGLGAVAEAPGVWLFLGSENGRRPNFPHGGASTTGAAQRAIGSRSGARFRTGCPPDRPAAPRPPASAARRGASAWGRAGVLGASVSSPSRGANAWDQRAPVLRGSAPLARSAVSDPE